MYAIGVGNSGNLRIEQSRAVFTVAMKRATQKSQIRCLHCLRVALHSLAFDNHNDVELKDNVLVRPDLEYFVLCKISRHCDAQTILLQV